MFVNLTPHTVNIYDAYGVEQVATLPPSGTIARVESVRSLVEIVGGVPTYAITYGQVYDLPEPEEGVYYVVSAMVRSACKGREDVFSPGDLIRDDEGRPVGCKGLNRF